MSLTYHLWNRETDEITTTEDVFEWSQWFENVDNRRVARDKVGPLTISTVALGLDHGFGMGMPQIFETLVYSKNPHELTERDQRLHAGMRDVMEHDMIRYPTPDDARAGHALWVARARGELVGALERAE